MTKIILNITIPFLISGFIYLCVAAVLIIIGKPKEEFRMKNNISFNELIQDYGDLPELSTYSARNGSQLQYRHYPGDSDKIVILLHGSGGHSRYFYPLAKTISAKAGYQVYTPDLRGHGVNPERRGDVDYIGQLEDDLSDFITLIKQKHADAKIILGGHSSGGGLAIRFAGGKYGTLADAYLLLSPYLQYNAPTLRPNSGGWARPYTKRIIGLVLLNNIGIHAFDYLPAIDFQMAAEVRNGLETLCYTHRLNTSYAPRNYKKDLRAIDRPLLLVAGRDDEAFYADKFKEVITKYTEGKVVVLPDITHIGLVLSPATEPVILDWLQTLPGES